MMLCINPFIINAPMASLLKWRSRTTGPSFHRGARPSHLANRPRNGHGVASSAGVVPVFWQNRLNPTSSKWTGWFQHIPKRLMIQDHPDSGFLWIFFISMRKKTWIFFSDSLPLYWSKVSETSDAFSQPWRHASPASPASPAPPPPHRARSVDPQPPPAPFPDLLPAAPREGRNERITGMVDLWWIYGGFMSQK